MRKRNGVRSAPAIALGSALLLELAFGVTTSPETLAAPPSRSAAGSSRLAATPPMGFSVWNAFGCGVDEATVRAIADTMVADGLRDAGYHFLNLDDCWGAPKRNAVGKLEAHPTRFASGMPALGRYLHAREFGFGIYADAGVHSCSARGFPGSLRHEVTDARSFARWGVDYLKYDNCGNRGIPAPKRFRAMRNALDRITRPIVYSIATAGRFKPLQWAPRMGNLWRTGRDIHPAWASVMANLHDNEKRASFAGPGHWNDPDMLEVGNRGLSAPNSARR